MKVINMFILFAFLAACAFAQSPSPSASGVPLDVATSAIDSVLDWLNAHIGIISSVIGFLWLVVVKVVRNEKAGKVVSVMQAWTDGLARLLSGVVMLLAKLSEILASMIKSDGFLGKK